MKSIMRLHDVYRKSCRSYKELQDIIAILGMEELSEEDKTNGVPCKKNPTFPVTAVPCG